MKIELVLSAVLGGVFATLLNIIFTHIKSRTQKLRRMRKLISNILAEVEVARHAARNLEYDRIPDPKPSNQLFGIPKLSHEKTSDLAHSIYHDSMSILRASQSARLHLKDAESAENRKIEEEANMLHSSSIETIEEKVNPLTHNCEELIDMTREWWKFILYDV